MAATEDEALLSSGAATPDSKLSAGASDPVSRVDRSHSPRRPVAGGTESGLVRRGRSRSRSRSGSGSGSGSRIGGPNSAAEASSGDWMLFPESGREESSSGEYLYYFDELDKQGVLGRGGV